MAATESRGENAQTAHLSICDQALSSKTYQTCTCAKNPYGIGIKLLMTDANSKHETTLTWNKVATILLAPDSEKTE
ncbi:hypothetical protein CHI02_21020 [Niallia circulans]|uniref:hypothetical protein n=1 Tax=Niallia circulans TaxID=1397 RepID=UPI000BA5D83E|nr:hypothetical protein [Niallia circulans]PAE10182.1 hypothetical protein CHI02_21020 [Niallia circulans]